MSFDEQGFQQLRSDRLAYIDGLRRNRGFEEGILRILTQLYPDNAHFIYELLQNAEDAEAKHVRFQLFDDHLVFEHDGKKLFLSENVESITSIGDSTKVDDPTKIGKFGVGFKAVFAYTQSPEIHSGDYHFRIRDLVVPELIPASHTHLDGFTTTFRFPFDHARKVARQAASEIAGALRKLDDSSLLFLRNIHRITYVLADGSQGFLDRSAPPKLQQAQSSGEHILVAVQSPGGELQNSSWLRYARSVEIEDEGERKSCGIALAFGLEEGEGKTKKSRWRVAPLNPGRVCIYFPAEKETSNLKFHIHAPFASTVARDSVRDCEGNSQLLGALADLAADSMEDVRDRGLLTVEALRVLPIKDDNLSPFYVPIRERLTEAFKSNDLVPTKSGSHRKAEALFRGPSDIVNLISDEDLTTIIKENRSVPLWCANPPQRNQREDKFLDTLEIDRWGWEELCDALKCGEFALYLAKDFERLERLRSWLEAKSDDWLQRLYGLLNEARLRHYQHIEVADLEIIRADSSAGPRMVKPAECFFVPSEASELPADILFVRKETYQSGRSEAQKNAARSLLEDVGVRVYDEVAEIETILRLYAASGGISRRSHLVHIRRFIAFHKSSPERRSIFDGKAILLGQSLSDDENLKFLSANNLLLDLPFEDTGLSAIEGESGKRKLWSGYEKLGSKRAFVEFVRALGIRTELTVRKASTAGNLARGILRADYNQYRVRWTDSGIDIDWTVDRIERFAVTPTLEGNRLLWTTITTARPEIALARFRPNRQYSIREADSQLVCWLKSNAWIPDRDGEFHKPQDIDRTQLPSGYLFDDRNGLLTAIGFGEAARRQSVEFKAKDAAARDIGFEGVNEATKVVKALREAGVDPSDLAALLASHAKKPAQPEDRVGNPDRRRRGIQEHRENAPAKESVRRERQIQIGVREDVAKAKAYLRAKYTNDDDEMVCQACHERMPFKLQSGEYYFEAVQVIKGLEKNFYENRLALCPTCAAKYQYACSTPSETILDAIRSADAIGADGNISLPIVLGEKEHMIIFVQTHMFDLQVVIGPAQQQAVD
jgi:hypothetical protein